MNPQSLQAQFYYEQSKIKELKDQMESFLVFSPLGLYQELYIYIYYMDKFNCCQVLWFEPIFCSTW